MTDHREEYILNLEKSIKEKEREIRELEPQVAPLQEIVTARHADMEVAQEFANSCEADFDAAYYARKKVEDRIDDRRKFLKRDNDLLNGALRRRREEELKERKRKDKAK